MGLRGRRHQNARIASLLAGRGLRPIRGLPYVIWKQRCARSHRLPQRVKGATAQSPPPPFLCPRGSPQTRAGRVASPPPASSSRDVPLPTFPRGRALVCSGYPKPQDQPLQGGLRPVFSRNGPRYRAPQSKNQPGSETRERLPHGRGRSGERKAKSHILKRTSNFMMPSLFCSYELSLNLQFSQRFHGLSNRHPILSSLKLPRFCLGL